MSIKPGDLSLSSGYDFLTVIRKNIRTWGDKTRIMIKPIFLPLFMLSLGNSSLQGALLAYDGFDTTVYDASGGYASPADGASNALVHGNPGTAVGQDPAVTGFNSAGWFIPTAPSTGANNIYRGNSQASTVYARLQATQSMSYTTAADQRLNTTTGEVSIFRSTAGSNDRKAYSRILNLQGGLYPNSHTTLYYSGLFSFAGSVTDSFIQSASGQLDTYSNYRPFGMNIGADGSLTAIGNGGTSASLGAGTIVAGQTYFYVWKLEDGGTTADKLTLYLSPADLAGEAGNLATLSITDGNFYVAGNNTYSIKELRFGSSITAGNQFLVDEFRIGTTWEDVVPFHLIPEPASTGLAAIGLLRLLRRRR